ncbi:hypothetical protein NQ317_016385 [Molorchus minor]|uniref:Invertebrate defensins family profile domain-containing protein n=1 Tax=Molorchus minor TaxID=1323400 RepID=A0ABQ9JKT5_9CUCU|nr:hypothetical protein NQ317_016385 [Molorchus minor]
MENLKLYFGSQCETPLSIIKAYFNTSLIFQLQQKIKANFQLLRRKTQKLRSFKRILVFALAFAVVYTASINNDPLSEDANNSNPRLSADEVIPLHMLKQSTGVGCSQYWCDSRCREISWAGGFCYTNECWCYR